MPAPSSSSRREGPGWRPALTGMLRLHLGDSAACLVEHIRLDMEHAPGMVKAGPEIPRRGAHFDPQLSELGHGEHWRSPSRTGAGARSDT